MTPTSYNAEADIAVLKEQLVSLTQRVGQVAEQQASNFGALNARFDTLTPLVQDITRLQERHDGHRRSIDHAFELIRTQDTAFSDLKGDIAGWRTAHAQDHAHVEKRLNTQRGWFMAGSLLTSVTLGMIIWVANLFIAKIEAIDTLAHQNQITQMQHQLDEARKGDIREH